MGKLGLLYELEALPDREQGGEEAVRAAVFYVLRDEWDMSSWKAPRLFARARDWLDDVLTLRLEDDALRATVVMVLYFDLSVDWPSRLAQHWLEVTLATGRLTLDDKLAAAGYRLVQHGDTEPLPSLMACVQRRGRDRDDPFYVVHEKMLCELAHGRLFANEPIDDEGEWEGERGLASLAPTERERIEKLVAEDRCGCPLCENARGNFGAPLDAAWNGHEMELVMSWPSNDEWRWIPAAGFGALFIAGEAYSGALVYTTEDAGERLERAHLPDLRRGPIHSAVTIHDAVYHLLLVGHGENGSIWFQSHSGRRWTRVDDRERPSGVCEGLVAHESRPSLLVAWTKVANQSALHVSLDGGRTWRALVAPAPNIHHVTLVSDQVLVVIASSEPSVRSVYCTMDGGATWTACSALSFRPEEVLVGADLRTLCVFGTELEGETPKRARRARSTDGGATWTLAPETGNSDRHRSAVAHPSGRWFHFPASSEVMQFSDDEGLTWQPATALQPISLAVDSSRDKAILAHSFGTVRRVTWT